MATDKKDRDKGGWESEGWDVPALSLRAPRPSDQRGNEAAGARGPQTGKPGHPSSTRRQPPSFWPWCTPRCPFLSRSPPGAPSRCRVWGVGCRVASAWHCHPPVPEECVLHFLKVSALMSSGRLRWPQILLKPLACFIFLHGPCHRQTQIYVWDRRSTPQEKAASKQGLSVLLGWVRGSEDTA